MQRYTRGTPIRSQLVDILEVEDTLQVTVVGDCMAPVLSDDQSVTVQKRAVYYPGDILVFAAFDGTPLIHRFLGWVPGRNGLRAMTRADASGKIDVLVPRGHVLGKALQRNGDRIPVTVACRVRAFTQYIHWIIRLSFARVRGSGLDL